MIVWFFCTLVHYLVLNFTATNPKFTLSCSVCFKVWYKKDDTLANPTRNSVLSTFTLKGQVMIAGRRRLPSSCCKICSSSFSSWWSWQMKQWMRARRHPSTASAHDWSFSWKHPPASQQRKTATLQSCPEVSWRLFQISIKLNAQVIHTCQNYSTYLQLPPFHVRHVHSFRFLMPLWVWLWMKVKFVNTDTNL